MATTYDVRVWAIETFEGKTAESYYVRWRAGSRRRKQAFKTKALADSFRTELLAATRRGEAFDADTGLPVSMSPSAATPPGTPTRARSPT